MPTYDYVCDACGHSFEKFQSITAPAIKKCPECGKRKVRRLIGTGAGIIFKGSGFYQTDYRSESYKQAVQKEKSSATPAASSTSASGSTSAKSDGAKKESSSSTGKSAAKSGAPSAKS